MHNGFVASAIALGLVSAALASQRGATVPQQPVFRSATELIQVDTVVVDKDGKPVHGLTKDDFEIYDNGTRQDVEVLTEYRHERVARGPGLDPPRVDVATNSGPAADRLVIVLLNDVAQGTWHPDVEREQTENAKSAVGHLLRELGGQSQLALVKLSGRPGIEFTSDPAMLLDGLSSFKIDARVGAGLLASIEKVLQYLTPNDGRRKTVIVVSGGGGGVDRRDAEAAIDPKKTPEERFAAQREIMGSLNPRLREFFDAARQANASIYFIDRRGAPKPWQTTTAPTLGPRQLNFSNPYVLYPASSGAALRMVAAYAGGLAVTETDDFATGVARIVDELDSYYLLGFRAPDPKSKKPREIEVRVRRPDLEARHRRQYVLNAAPTKADKAGRKDALLGLAHSPVPSADLPLRAWAVVRPPADGQTNATVSLWLDSAGVRLHEYAVYVVDMKKQKESGKPVGRTLEGSVPALLPLEPLALPAGRYQLRVAARSEDAGRGGSVYLTIEVPDFATTPLAIAGLVIGAGAAGRRDLGSLPFAPTLERTFAESARLRVAFDVWRPAVAGGVLVDVEMVSPDGSIARQVERRTLDAGSTRVDAPLVLAGLAPGPYTLRISAASGATAVRTEIGFAVGR